jgi:hypothetical protein
VPRCVPACVRPVQLSTCPAVQLSSCSDFQVSEFPSVHLYYPVQLGRRPMGDRP